MIILLHTSKTMRTASYEGYQLQVPVLNDKAQELANYMHTLTPNQLMDTMHISAKLAGEVSAKYDAFSVKSSQLSPAVDSFIGDIYSGLQASLLDKSDRHYANKHLRILSGLYGVLKPLDGILPYRLEMGYKLPKGRYANLYTFWGESVVKTFPLDELIVNLAAVEYSRLVTPYVDTSRIVTPRFLTISEKTGEPVFVVVHAKIARGAFARWMIQARIDSAERLHEFSDIGYRYDASLSTPSEPVFVCKEFGGKGLSIRLEGK